MPWLPEFVTAVELARRQAREAGEADPVGQYVSALNRGDAHALEDAWPGTLVVHDPRAGEVHGHRQLREFVRRSQALLAGLDARIDTMASIAVGHRAVVELLVHLDQDGRAGSWPVAIVADSPDDRSVVFRSYFSQRILDGLDHVRHPVLEPGTALPGDVVGRYQTALAAGDATAVVSTFAPEGYFREPLGPHRTHRGPAELRTYFDQCFDAGGGLGLEYCTVTDDGVRCALEYNFLRWGSHDLTPQAGIAVHERGPDGLLRAVRVYDDVRPPGGTGG